MSKERQPLLTLDRVWVVVALTTPALAVLFGEMWTVDLAYQVRAGATMLASHQVLRSDAWTFTVAGQPWTNQQWGAQILLALAHRLAGWPGLAVLRALLAGAIYLMVLLGARAAGASLRNAALLTLGACMASVSHLQMRPQTFAVLLFMIVHWLLLTRERHPRRIWFVPCLVLLWANLHGSFMLGPLLVAFACMDDWRNHSPGLRRSLLVLALSFLATLVTPFGPGVWIYAWSIARNPTIHSVVDEWAPPSFSTLPGAAFLLAVLAVTVICLWRRKHVTWVAWVQLGVFCALGMLAVRSALWFALIAPTVVAAALPASEPSPPRVGSVIMNYLFVAILGVGLVILQPWARGTYADGSLRILKDAPMALVAASRRSFSPGARLFVVQPLAAWFEFALPETRLFVDSRIELFPKSVWDDYLAICRAQPGWPDRLRQHGVDGLVLTTEQASALRKALDGTAGWRLVFQDANGSLFARSETGRELDGKTAIPIPPE